MKVKANCVKTRFTTYDVKCHMLMQRIFHFKVLKMNGNIDLFLRQVVSVNSSPCHLILN